VDNDKVFVAYALILVACIGSLLATMVAGNPFPQPLSLLAHLGMSLMMRASYKSLGGWDPSEWTLAVGRPRAAAARPAIPAGPPAGAEA